MKGVPTRRMPPAATVATTPVFALSEHQVLTSHHGDAERPRTCCLRWSDELESEETSPTSIATRAIVLTPRTDALEWHSPGTDALRGKHLITPRRNAAENTSPQLVTHRTHIETQRQLDNITFKAEPPPPQPIADDGDVPTDASLAQGSDLSWTNTSPEFLSLKVVLWTSPSLLPVVWLECPTVQSALWPRVHRGDVLMAVNCIRVVPMVDIMPPRKASRRRPWVLQFTNGHMTNYTVRWGVGTSLGVAFRRVHVMKQLAASSRNTNECLTVVAAVLPRVERPAVGRSRIQPGDVLVAINGTLDAVQAGFSATQEHLARLPRPIELTFRGVGHAIARDPHVHCHCVVQ
ncbi:hypothetical protein DYB32_002961 [Aphanomyces invadans]|uniref:Uncharacterized protein n=1 Tax=Aphanomyces invadans TaxID=157072 RepID=A0A3R6ZT68_9STRA|nr:hypothetical protein DYB32_002961 [Aphanomyces invadans]